MMCGSTKSQPLCISTALLAHLQAMAKAHAKCKAKDKPKAKAKGKPMAKAVAKPVAKAVAKVVARPVAKAVAKAVTKAGAKVTTSQLAMGKEKKGQAKGWDGIQEGATSMGSLGAQTVKDHLKLLAREGKPQALAHYENLKGNKAKLDFALKLKVDREGAFMQLTEEHKVEVSKMTGEEEGWLTQDQIAIHEGLSHYMDQPHQKQLLDEVLEGLAQRPHYQVWRAAKGHKQFFYHKEDLNKNKVCQTSSMLATASSKVEKDSFDEIQASISSDTAYMSKAKAKPIKPKDPVKELSEEEKIKVAWIKDTTTLLKSLEGDCKLFLRLKLNGQQVKDNLPKDLLFNLEECHKSCQENCETVTEALEIVKVTDPSDFDQSAWEETMEKAKDHLKEVQGTKQLGQRIIMASR